MTSEVRIGGAYIDYGAKTANFEAGSRRVNAALQRQRREFRALRNSMRPLRADFARLRGAAVRLGGALLAVAGVGGMGAAIKSSTALGARLIELSNSTGLTVRRLQGLTRVFEGDGIAIDKAEKALQRFVRTLGEAREGYMKRRVEVYAALGVDPKAFETTEEALVAVTDALDAMEDKTQQAVYAYEIFGRQGIDLLPVLRRGGAALIEQAEAMERFGTVSRAEAARLKALEQAFTDFKNASRTAVASIVAEFTPEIRAMVDGATEWATTLRDRVVPSIRWTIQNLGQLSDTAAYGLGVWIAWTRRLDRVATHAARFAGSLLTLTGAIAGLRRGLTLLLGLFRRFLVIGLIIEGVLLLVDAWGKVREAMRRIDWNTVAVAGLDAVSYLIDGFATFWNELYARGKLIVQNLSGMFVALGEAGVAALDGRLNEARAIVALEEEAARVRIRIHQRQMELGTYRSNVDLAGRFFTDAEIVDARIRAKLAGEDLAEGFTRAFEKRVEAWRRSWKMFTGGGGEASLGNVTIEDYREYGAMSGTIPDLGSASLPVAEIKESTKALKEMTEEMRNAKRLSQSLESTMTSGLENMIFGTEKFGMRSRTSSVALSKSPFVFS